MMDPRDAKRMRKAMYRAERRRAKGRGASAVGPSALAGAGLEGRDARKAQKAVRKAQRRAAKGRAPRESPLQRKVAKDDLLSVTCCGRRAYVMVFCCRGIRIPGGQRLEIIPALPPSKQDASERSYRGGVVPRKEHRTYRTIKYSRL